MSRAAYTVDGALVERGRFYAIACNPRRSVVVEACAGAGKTWMLVSRILRALLDGVAPQDIVAITFTRKAAGEMRQRLSEWLHEFARCSAERRIDELQARGMTLEQARTAEPLLAGLQERLLGQGRSVEIRTFHAWFAQLLRVAPLELLQRQGISAELQLLEDEADLLPQLWQRFHAAVLADEALLADYRQLVAERGRNTLQRWLESAFEKRVEIRLGEAQLMEGMPGAESIGPEFVSLTHPLEYFPSLRSRLAALAVSLGGAKAATPRKAATSMEQGLSCADDAAAFDAVRAALFTARGEPRKNLGDDAELSACLDELDKLWRACAQQRACDDHRRMARLALVLIAQFEQLKRQRGLVDMNDLERGALALLADPQLSGWVQQRLDAQVRHLLIDEFQDTSPLQWHALYGWLSSYAGAGADAPSVFIVGDPKQSIYRFRRAEPRVFAAARDFVQQALAGAVLACDHTRRNAAPVLAAVNEVFESARAAQQYPDFRIHTTEVGEPGALDGLFQLEVIQPESVEAQEPDDQRWRPSLSEPRREPELHRRAAEAQAVVAAIAELLGRHGLRPGQIFVLARKREPLRVLAQALKAAGIAHAAPEDQALLDAPDVRDLLALLDALASPSHKLSLAHALRSPLLGASEDELLWLAARAETLEGDWWRALQSDDLPEGSLPRARRLLADWLLQVGRCSPHELLDRVVHQGELVPRMLAVVPPSERRTRVHAVEALLALALDLDGGRYANLYGFVRALKSRALKLSAPVESEAVQLLTVHGAKGLEAEVVFLLDCEAGSARAESATLLIDWPVQAERPSRVAFLASESKAPPALQPLLDEEKLQRQREELNALYVALTRARARLVISRTPALKTSSRATWWSRLGPLATPWQTAPTPVQASATSAARWLDLPSAPPLPPPRAASSTGEADDAASAQLGEALHRVLEWASGPASQPLPRLMASAAQMYGLDAKRTELLERSVAAILGSSDCARFFAADQLQWAGNEVAVSVDGLDQRIDRLVCLQEQGQPVWWVLDYKLNPAPQRKPEYLAQLDRYRRAVQTLQPGERVRTAFITAEGKLLETG
ncbi:UvrD-helicase domain-containing protein [Pelomonas sp. SE-A7]|uniref:UvrD-helicase domain-containing protein n=1 Tax=Pelomonas sp. SE-A7 TaxID=3054953 RepID=UPI00259CA0DC|nr:UvrD-helicase domain-containing protein [Pelomonas sp. SE-A7]MDM4764842.1 UvrD-helicase domain-containing protein [Pelomonas sp. SE-A7]